MRTCSLFPAFAHMHLLYHMMRIPWPFSHELLLRKTIVPSGKSTVTKACRETQRSIIIRIHLTSQEDVANCTLSKVWRSPLPSLAWLCPKLRQLTAPIQHAPPRVELYLKDLGCLCSCIMLGLENWTFPFSRAMSTNFKDVRATGMAAQVVAGMSGGDIIAAVPRLSCHLYIGKLIRDVLELCLMS